MLGVCLMDGIGCKKNPEEAEKWLRMAGKQGDKPAGLVAELMSILP
ncbi:MAG: SEL1-like repeat protein [Thermoguttaceae bacterium]|nr:SEL1-like repeat protein [Thermoguttaceae bacterium]